MGLWVAKCRDWGFSAAVILATVLCLQGGCGTRRFTDTPRTASEQLLVAASVDRAVAQLDFFRLFGRKVFVDADLVDRVDKPFLVSSVRRAAWEAGAAVCDSADEADYVLELRSGAVGIDRDDYLLGIPAAQLPTPGGTAPIPEAPLFKTTNQTGATRLSFVVYERETRELLYTAGPAYGFSGEQTWWLFGAGPNLSGDVRPPNAPQEAPAAGSDREPGEQAGSQDEAASPAGEDAKEQEPTPRGDAQGPTDTQDGEGPSARPTGRPTPRLPGDAAPG